MTNHRDAEQIEDCSCTDSQADVANVEKIKTNPECKVDKDVAGGTIPCDPNLHLAANHPHGDLAASSHPWTPSYPNGMHLSWQDNVLNPSPIPLHLFQQPAPYCQNNLFNHHLNAPHLGHQPSHLLHFFESQMRDHAAAFANAAAGAAFVSAQIAADIASASTATNLNQYPVAPHFLPQPPYVYQNIQMQPCIGPPNPQFVGNHGPIQPEHHLYGNFEDEVFENSSSSECAHRRRKRQHRGPPSAVPQDRDENASLSYMSPVAGPTGRRRRRSRNNILSHSKSQSPSFNSTNRRRNRRIAMTSSGSDGGNVYNITKKKKRQPEPDNISLIGKTGVAALYVFCEKRRTTPHFRLKDRNPGKKDASAGVEDFEIVVSVDGHDCGLGRGKNKSGAKQEAARLALQTLLPGVEFDKASGILVRLPESSVPRKNSHDSWSQRDGTTTAEDLAPNLAKLLAIGRENEMEDPSNRISGSDAEKMCVVEGRKHVYPETSTTSEEEDEDTYYASRGASVCSALLHAMVQIDPRIPEPPVYTYHVSVVGPPPRSQLDLKRKAGGPLYTASVVHRGSFNCTGTMGVEVRNPDPGQPSFDILQAIGVGGTKREARHRASAKLLAMLFPECEGMVAVKEAAEAFREKYAADKALKHQSKSRVPSDSETFVDSAMSQADSNNSQPPQDCQFAKSEKGPVLSPFTENHILCALEDTSSSDGLTVTSSVGPLKSRQLSRQTQLDNAISLALQKLNEHDEGGRSLPDELTVDDVGRTVLRRSTPADVHWIMNLAEGDALPLSSRPPSYTTASRPNQLRKQTGEEYNSPLLCHWLSSTVVLLLCRAIAPFEDPPLGCAALTLGFSMEKGRTLRVTQIASKSHLPLERFIEVLQTFAREMRCTLEVSRRNSGSFPIKVPSENVEDILQSHLEPQIDFLRKQNKLALVPKIPSEEFISSRLQSVREELEDIADFSGVDCASEKRNSKPRQVNPSKRTRVQ